MNAEFARVRARNKRALCQEYLQDSETALLEGTEAGNRWAAHFREMADRAEREAIWWHHMAASTAAFEQRKMK